MDKNTKLVVTFHHRKRWPNANFSIETIFENLRHDLAYQISATVIGCPNHSRGVWPRIKNLLHARRCQSDVNHVTGDVNYLAIGLERRRTILTHHDSSFMVRTRGLKRFILGLFWLRLPVWRSKWITTVSQATKDELVAYTRCDPAKVIVIHNAISELFKPVLKADIGSPPRILQLGTASNKNIPRLANALQGLQCKLVVIGKLSDSQCQLLNDAKINFENFFNLSDAEVREHYINADIVSFASTVEGFGMPILEAQATGRAVVTSNCSSMPEVAGNAACLVDPLDPQSIREGISKVIDDHEYRQNLITAGFENIKRFDRMAIANQYLALYRQIANQTTTVDKL